MHLESSLVPIPVFLLVLLPIIVILPHLKLIFYLTLFTKLIPPPFSYPTDMHNNFYHMLDPTEDNMVVVFGPPLPILADLDPQQSVSEGIVEFHTCLTKILPPAGPPAKS